VGANTTKISGSTISIVPHSTFDADWLWDTELSEHSHMGGIWITAIQFNPSTANDIMIVHNGSDLDGAPLFHSGTVPTIDPKIKYFNPPKYCTPVIDASDCTLTTPETCLVTIELY